MPFVGAVLALSLLAPRPCAAWRHAVPHAVAPRGRVAMTAAWSTVVGRGQDAADAWAELERAVDPASAPPDIALLFFSPSHAARLKETCADAARALSARVLLGIVGAGVIGGGEEIDREPAIALIAGRLPPGTEARAFAVGRDQMPAWGSILPRGDPADADAGADAPHGNRPAFLLFADPFSAISQAAACLNSAWPGSVVCGGLSCPPTPSTKTLAVYQTGATTRVLPPGSVLGIAMRGPRLAVHTVCAQGASRLGPSFAVTAAQNNIVSELDGQPAVAALESVAREVATDERLLKLLREGLLVGISPEDGGKADEDYLVRQVLGVSEGGGLAIGEPRVVAGETRLQFHVRDAQAATDDLRLLLQRYRMERQFAASGGGAPLAALLFSCVGRGTSLFAEPNADSAALAEHGALGAEPPIGGFFCNGEIAPLGVRGVAPSDDDPDAWRAHVHGFTSVFALLWDTGGDGATQDDDAA